MSGRCFFIGSLSSSQIALARASGIDLLDYTIEQTHGVLFAERLLQPLLHCLSLTAFNQADTRYDGIVSLMVKPTAAATALLPATNGESVTGKTVRFDYRLCPSKIRSFNEEIRDIVRRVLLPAIRQREIMISYPCGSRKVSTAQHCFHVRIHATAMTTMQIGSWYRPKNTANFSWWGQDLPAEGRQPMFQPSGQGIQIVDPVTGEIAAELINGTDLYVLFDLFRGRWDISVRPEELIVFERLCLSAAAAITSKQITTAADPTLTQTDGTPAQTDRERYVALCQKWREQTKHAVRHHAEELRLRVNKLQEQLTMAVREFVRAEQRQIDEQITEHEHCENFGLEYDRLLALEQVTKVEVKDDLIAVYTKPLCCTDPRTDTVHEIGKFRIEIYPSGRDDGIRWFNLTRQVNAWSSEQQAPHIWRDGKACLGNMADVIPQLLGKREFALLATMAIAFVESVNVNDRAGQYVGRWPKAKP